MYAIVEIGGQQYRVTEGDTIRVERLPQHEGEKLDIDRVLLLAVDGEVNLGQPLVSGAKVRAQILDQGLGPKVQNFQFRAKKRYKKLSGHHQPFTFMLIESITFNGRRLTKKEEEKVTLKKAAKPKAPKKAATRKASPKVGHKPIAKKSMRK